MFGDSTLFEEFDKERDTSASFIFYEKGDDGVEDRSTIHFQVSDSSSDDSSDDEDHKTKVKQSVGRAVGKLLKQSGKLNDAAIENGQGSDGESDSEELESKQSLISQDRLDRASTYKLNYERILQVNSFFVLFFQMVNQNWHAMMSHPNARSLLAVGKFGKYVVLVSGF